MVGEKRPVPVIVMEEHKEAYYVWHLFSEMGMINKFDNILLHVDHHGDDLGGLYGFDPSSLPGDLDFSKKLSYEELGVANFILPAVYEKMFIKTVLLSGFGKNVKYERRYIDHKYGERNGISMHVLDYVKVQDDVAKSIDEGEKNHFFSKVRGFDNFQGGLGDYGDFGYPVVLDIDLDYFCWDDSMRGAEDAILEITEDTWQRIKGNTYDAFRLLACKHYDYMQKDGKYYVRILNESAFYESVEQITDKILQERIIKFFDWLGGQKFVPAAIDICRSRISGYLNTDYFPLVENEVLRRLDELYGTEVLFRPEI